MKKILFLAMITIVISSCTGGNQSVIGKPGFFDYLPSFFMVAGILSISVGAYLFAKAKKATPAVKWTISWGVLGFLFGLATYFA